MKNIKTILEELRENGFHTISDNDLELQTKYNETKIDLLNYRYGFSVNYDVKNGTMKIETSFSNQAINQEWIDKVNKLWDITDNAVKNQIKWHCKNCGWTFVATKSTKKCLLCGSKNIS
jgi:rubrerythrin